MAKQPSGRGSVKLSAAASTIKKRLKGVKVIGLARGRHTTPRSRHRHRADRRGQLQGQPGDPLEIEGIAGSPHPHQRHPAAGYRTNQVHAAGLIAGHAGPAGQYPTLQVHPGRRCNLQCLHCYSDSGPAVSEQLNIDLLQAAVADAAAIGYKVMPVSGGNPAVSCPGTAVARSP